MFYVDDSVETYENELLEEAKQDKRIQEGMLVRVYSSAESREYVGTGLVMSGSLVWDDKWFYQYLVDVQLPDKVYEGVPIGFLEREVGRNLRRVL